MPKTISIDLDGVLNTYHGDYDNEKISPIKEGAVEFLAELSKDYKLEIFTVRDRELVKNWLEDNKISVYISDITNAKNPYSSVYVDDRAINFDGNYSKTIKEIKEFKPYWRKTTL